MLDLAEEAEDEFEAGVVELAGGAEVFDAAELAEPFGVEEHGGIFGPGHRLEEALFLVTDHGLRDHSRQFGDDFEGIPEFGFILGKRDGIGR